MTSSSSRVSRASRTVSSRRRDAAGGSDGAPPAVETFTVGANQFRALLASFAELGLSTDALLRQCELSRAALDDPDVRFPEAQLLALWLAAERVWSEGLLGLHAGASAPLGAFGLTDFLVGSSPTVGTGFERLARYGAIINTGLTYAIEHRSRVVVVTIRHPYAFDFLPPSFVEYLWTILVTRFRDHVDARFRPTLDLPHQPQGPLAVYRRILGMVVFGAERAALHVPRAQWELENPGANADLSRVLERHARDVVERSRENVHRLHAVHAVILESMSGGDASIEDVAARLSVTPRTLQRRLAAAGYTYKDALDELRCELARTYLTTTSLSLAEIAALLAYSEPSAFSRAFKRWTGVTPIEHRRRRAARA